MINGDYINSLIENIPLGIAISDGDGFIKDVNLKFMEMFGYKAEELLGKHISDLFDGFKLVKKALLDNINIVREEVFIYGRKNKLRYSLSAFPLPAANEASMDILFIFEDIKKERKLANDILHNRAIYTFDKIISKTKNF